jgi:hypothetical protein
MAGPLLTALALAFALCGCVKTVTAVTLASDDTFTLSAVTAFSEEFIDQAATSMGKTRDQLMAEIRAGITAEQTGVDLGQEALMEDYQEDGYIGWVFTSREPSPITELNANPSPSTQITVTRQDDQFLVAVVTDLTDAGVNPQQFEELGVDPATMADQIAVEVSFTFPGPVISGDGLIEGNTITFNPPFGQVSEYSAIGGAGEAIVEVPPETPPTVEPPSPSPSPVPTDTSEPTQSPSPVAASGGGSWPPWAVFALAGGALAAVAALTWFVLARRRQAAAGFRSAPPGGYGDLPTVAGSAAVFYPQEFRPGRPRPSPTRPGPTWPDPTWPGPTWPTRTQTRRILNR